MTDLVESLDVTQWGHSDKTIVLGHGFGTDQTCWKPQIDMLLNEGYQVFTFDFAGATANTVKMFDPLRHQSLYGFAEDLIMLMESLNISAATYIGHSMGGMVGLLAQNGNKGMFNSLILLGSSACYINDMATDYVGGFSRENIDSLLQAMQENYTVWANGFAPLVVGQSNPYLSNSDFTQNLLKLRPDVAHAVLKAAFLSDHRIDVDQLDTPLYVLQTSVDHAVPTATANWLAEHGKAQKLFEISTQGHLPHITAPQLVNNAIIECLKYYEKKC